MDKEHLRDQHRTAATGKHAADDANRIFKAQDKDASQLKKTAHQEEYRKRRTEEVQYLKNEERRLESDRHERTTKRFKQLFNRSIQYKIKGPKAPSPEYLEKKAATDILEHDEATMEMKRREAKERLGGYLKHAAREEGITLKGQHARTDERLRDTFGRHKGL